MRQRTSSIFISRQTIFFILCSAALFAQDKDSLYISQHYTKYEYKIPMRDGVKLFTAVYIPKDTTQAYPIMLNRTPYRIGPYGTDKFPDLLGPNIEFTKDGYIFVYQDVRGKFMSEGEFVNTTPLLSNSAGKTATDESTDAYDTIDWLINHIRNHNGKVGAWGISYPGFYAAMTTINAHPNLVAVSPQAPISDWFIGDDMHHNGALSLLMTFDFFSVFGLPRPEPISEWPAGLTAPTPDAYTFFLSLRSLKNINDKFFFGKIAFWNDVIKHGTYDDFWKSRNTLSHYRNIKPATLIVGGWYDSEDLYGTLHTFQAIEQSASHNFNSLVMGPWYHHGWPVGPGNSFGDIQYKTNTGEYFRDSLEFPFFNFYLKGKGSLHIPKAVLFETGSNTWKSYDEYPPKNLKVKNLYIQPNDNLSFEAPENRNNMFDKYVSDPAKPVPYTSKTLDAKRFYYRYYMNEDQRFAYSRPDVMSYTSEALGDNLTILGPIEAELYVSTTCTDADWVVKLIDVFPDDAVNPSPNPNIVEMGGYQMLLRGEIMRGKFRNSYEKPEAFEPDKPTKVKVVLQDVSHTFLKGHKIMVQIQNSWFPFFDRNPQKFCDIYNAEDKDFQRSLNKIFHCKDYPSHLKLGVVQ